ncbi:RNA 2',3'-cyclic phosphodiesterase [Euzebya sp.]|uniref:RNA 2',3'-cyclic phosphodiesterase n=1 Tax=Euzebya sp. TaxID=1971409 RepID=UPI0035126EAD
MRLFWAIGVPERVRVDVEVAVAPLRERWPDLRWTDPATWHLTLAFLGEVDDGLVDSVVGSVRDAVAGSAPVEVRLQAAAGTPGGRAGIVWLPVAHTPALDDLAGTVRAACRPLAPADESRPFRGHLTLARIPRSVPGTGPLTRAVATAYAGPDVAWTADSVTLTASRTRPGGAAHQDVAEVHLTP